MLRDGQTAVITIKVRHIKLRHAIKSIKVPQYSVFDVNSFSPVTLIQQIANH